MSSILKKIIEATRLTGRGQLADATAAIQRALKGEAERAHAERARAEQAHPQQPQAHQPHAARAAAPGVATGVVDDDALVLDGLVREVPVAPADMPSRPRVDPAPEVHAPAGEPVPPAFRPADGAAASEARSDAASHAPARAPARFVSSSFTAAAGTRAFKLFIPPQAAAGTPLPLVVMLHGCTQDPDDFAAGTRMNALAEAQGFFVLYPAQAPRSNSHKCWNWFAPGDQRRGAGEPALLAGMARHVMQAHAIDPDRVYVAGLSAGGAMAAILAREYGDLFAAAGIHSGLPAGAARDVGSAFNVMKSGAAATPTRSAPLIVFHGDADGTVAARNGDAVIESVLAALPRGARTEGAGTAGGRAFRHTVWRAVDATADAPSLAEQWRISGAGHAWSGGSASGSYADAAGPDASREMLRFFLEHPRLARA